MTSTAEVTVRRVGSEGVPDALALAVGLASEGLLGASSHSVRRITETLRVAEERGVVLIAEMGGKAVGGIAGIVVASFYRDELVASEIGLFVHPQYRGCGVGRALINAFVAWGAESGASSAEIGDEAQSGSGMQELMQDMDFSVSRVSYTKRI